MKPASIFVQVVGLSALVLAVALSVGATVTLAIPSPAQDRMNVREMAWALELKPSSVVKVTDRDQPPKGPRALAVEETLAEVLHLPRARVHAVWFDDESPAVGQVTVESPPGGRAPAGTLFDQDTFVPRFAAALRQQDGTWRTGMPTNATRVAEWQTLIVLAFALAAVLLAFPVWWISRRIAQPIEALAKAADGTRLVSSEPFDVLGPREVRAAAEAMNAMHGRLNRQAAGQRRIIAALAHDLRTPITALRLRAEDAPAELRARLTADLERMSSMIDDCLSFATLGVIPRDPQPVRLDLLIRESLRARPPETASPGSLAEVTIVTDALRVRRALDNLIDNAVRYGEAATVSLLAADGWAVMDIADRGPGLPEDQISRLLQPFETMDPSRSRALGGSGLGLSIVSEIALDLGGSVSLRNGTIGLIATLRLPLRH